MIKDNKKKKVNKPSSCATDYRYLIKDNNS